jgi:hypothetical protein
MNSMALFIKQVCGKIAPPKHNPIPLKLESLSNHGH